MRFGAELASARLAKPRWFRNRITAVWIRIAALPNHGGSEVGGGQNGVCYRTGIPTLADAQFRKPKRLKSFEKKGARRVAGRAGAGAFFSLHEGEGSLINTIHWVRFPRNGFCPHAPVAQLTSVQKQKPTISHPPTDGSV